MSGNACCSAQSSWESHINCFWWSSFELACDKHTKRSPGNQQWSLQGSGSQPADALLVYVAAFLQALSCSSRFGHSLTPSQIHQADLADLLSRILHRWDMGKQQLRNSGMKHQHAWHWHHETLFFIIMCIKVSDSRHERRNCQSSYWSLKVTHIFSSKGLKHHRIRISQR